MYMCVNIHTHIYEPSSLGSMLKCRPNLWRVSARITACEYTGMAGEEAVCAAEGALLSVTRALQQGSAVSSLTSNICKKRISLVEV